MNPSPQRRIAYTIATLTILIPILAAFWNVQLGVFLLLMRLAIAYRAIRYGAHDDLASISDSEQDKMDLHQINRGRTMFVQIVDDFGRELPPDTVQRLMAEAQAHASPRDPV